MQDITEIQKKKLKEIAELVDLELKKSDFERQLENSFVQIRNMSELLQKQKSKTSSSKRTESEERTPNYQSLFACFSSGKSDKNDALKNPRKIPAARKRRI